jgi:hypothetical protein
LISKAEFFASLLLLFCIAFGWLRVTMALQAILPVTMIGLVARHPDLFSFLAGKSTASSGPPYSLGAFYVTNNLALLVWFRCVEEVGWVRMVELAAAVGIVLFSVSIVADGNMRRRRSWGGMVLLFLFNAMYGYVGTFELNVLLDRSPAAVQRSVVESKYYVIGRGGGDRLDIRPWGPVDQVKSVWVWGPVYRAVQAGGPVCMVLRQGALGIPWYTAHACPWNDGDPQVDYSLSPQSAITAP